MVRSKRVKGIGSARPESAPTARRLGRSSNATTSAGASRNWRIVRHSKRARSTSYARPRSANVCPRNRVRYTVIIKRRRQELCPFGFPLLVTAVSISDSQVEEATDPVEIGRRLERNGWFVRGRTAAAVEDDPRVCDLPAFFGPVITGEQRQLKFVVRLRVLPGQREPALPASALRHPSQP